MMGKSKKTQAKLFYHGISLERRVPKQHPLRKIKQSVDFSFIRSQVADTYGTNGNQSVDPAVILKLMFLLFYENVNSERALMRQLPLRLDWLWFCGYDLDEDTPDHSVLSKARKRWGPEVFEQFFMNILEQCIVAGLVDGETIHIDSSTIAANADINKVRPQLRKVTGELADKLEDDGEQENLEKRVNPADPDARIGRKYGKSTLGFKDHRVIDDKHGIVTSTITTPANTNDDKVLAEAVRSHHFKTKMKAKTVVGDKGYGTSTNYEYLKDSSITPCIPHQRRKSSQGTDFTSDKFVYDSIGDCYICPAGEKLKRISTNEAAGTAQYRTQRETCEKCDYFNRCVTGQKTGRSIVRNPNAKYYYKWADNCFSKHERYRLMRRRKYKVEGSFANAANKHGFKRARWRGLYKMQIQNLMIAAIQNLGKLLRYGGSDVKAITAAMTIKDFFRSVYLYRCRFLLRYMTCMSEY